MKEISLVCGVGINDASYRVTDGCMVNGKWKTTWKCPFYVTWIHMLNRCYGKGKRSNYQSYKDCSVYKGWHVFSEFAEWMGSQDWGGKHLDKDLLVPGNRIYSPDTCVFLPYDLNAFLVDQPKNRKLLPGVTFVKNKRKYQAQCRNPFSGKREFLGYFDLELEASTEWRRRKHKLACMYADMQIDPRIEKALRSRYA